jgi:hypothetical protein
MIEQASSNSPFGPISAPHVFTYQKRFAEDYLVEPDGDDTLFTSVVAIEPKDRLAPPVRALAPVIRAAFGKMPIDGQRYWAKHSQRG